MYFIFTAISIIWADTTRNKLGTHTIYIYTEMVLFINEDNNLTDSQSSVYLKRQASRFFNRGKDILDNFPFRCNHEKKKKKKRYLKTFFHKWNWRWIFERPRGGASVGDPKLCTTLLCFLLFFVIWYQYLSNKPDYFLCWIQNEGGKKPDHKANT